MNEIVHYQGVAMSPEELCEEYLRISALRPRTELSYRNVVAVFAKDTHVKDIKSVTDDLVIDWRDKILDRASETTWHTYQRTMRALWNYAIESGYLDHNPFKKVRSPRAVKKEPKLLPVRTIQRAIQYLNQCEGTDRHKPAWFWRTVFKTLFYTGIRAQQLVYLRWKDIDFEDRMITLRYRGSKTRREWRLPIPDEIYDDLRELEEKTLEYSMKTRAELKRDQVFRVQLFNPEYARYEMHTDQVFGFFRRLSQDLGERISAHRLRHTMATLLAAGGKVDLKTLQYILGHTDVRTTMGYLHPDPKTLRSPWHVEAGGDYRNESDRRAASAVGNRGFGRRMRMYA